MRRILSPSLAACFAFALSTTARAADYPRPELLVGPAELAALLDDGDVVVLHAGGDEAIPGATAVDVGAWKAAFGDSPEPAAAWGERIGAAGIGPDSRVVVYDDGNVTNAARIWWILRYWGVDDAALLNGGLPAWEAAGLDLVDADTLVEPTQAEYRATAHSSRLRTTEQMINLANAGGARIIDTRSDGEVTSLGKVNDATQHCEWVELIDPRTKRFKPAAELATLLDIDPTGEPLPVVTYCRSGGRASVTAFALELMGVDDVANYHGSWNAWSQRGGGQ